jgi:hypothetical protein
MIAEDFGDYPKALQQVLTVLLPKPDGGMRPINLFPGIFRLHGRIRSKLLKVWAAGPGKRAQVNMAARRHTGDGLYRHLTRLGILYMQTYSPTITHTGSVLWDLTKAFEHVDRGFLWEQASKYQYPLKWLRLSVASYAWGRTICTGKLAVSQVSPQRGIAAGSASATFELQLYHRSLVDMHTKACPQVTLSIHVDDIIRDNQGHEEEIMESFEASNKLIRQELARLQM